MVDTDDTRRTTTAGQQAHLNIMMVNNIQSEITVTECWICEILVFTVKPYILAAI